MLGRTKIRPVLQKLCIICIGWPMWGFFFCKKWYIYVDLIFMYWLLRRFYSLCLNVFFMYILTLHCIFLAPIYSRILAFWLMLSVVKTTLNEFYLILSYHNWDWIVEYDLKTRDHCFRCQIIYTLNLRRISVDKEFEWPGCGPRWQSPHTR